jgi:hypothetical protein
LRRSALLRKKRTESAFWLELIIEGLFLKESRVAPLLAEAQALTRIMAKSRVSASSKSRKGKSASINRK